MNIPAFKIAQLAEQHRNTLAALQFELSTNFTVPPLTQVNTALRQMGISFETYQRILNYLHALEQRQAPHSLVA